MSRTLMTASDPRHGRNRGYIAGCRAACCRAAHAREFKNRRARMRDGSVTSLSVDAAATRRRIQALMAIGHTCRDVDTQLGQAASYTQKVLTFPGPDIFLTTAQRIAEVYEQMAGTTPDTSTPQRAAIVGRTIRMAEAKGYEPAEAWADIETGRRPRVRTPADPPFQETHRCGSCGLLVPLLVDDGDLCLRCDLLHFPYTPRIGAA